MFLQVVCVRQNFKLISGLIQDSSLAKKFTESKKKKNRMLSKFYLLDENWLFTKQFFDFIFTQVGSADMMTNW